MGAVKTNRAKESFGLTQKPIKNKYDVYIRLLDGANNRRKLHGKPMIRRVMS
jgi:hypothetical protein